MAAELGLADHLPQTGSPVSPLPISELAQRVGVHSGSLDRFLRYLAALGHLTAVDGSYVLTRSTCCYARTWSTPSGHWPDSTGPFYTSFDRLLHAVHTGQDAFEHHFGANHFSYFAEHPLWGEQFDRGMAASAAMFGPVAAVVNRPGVETVVGIAGGNGELLAQLLTEVPRLRSVLLEREHTAAARAKLEKAGLADRCTFVVGDFTESVPDGGDAYLLSRVLHDWDEEPCRDILRRCAVAMPAHAELLVVERLLPEDSSASLAPAWDVHMMCNVSGRERTEAEYRGRSPTLASSLPVSGHPGPQRRWATGRQ